MKIFFNFSLAVIVIFFLSINLLAQNQIDFSAETLDNTEIQFSDVYKEGVTLVSFWALWCKPCRAEMRHLEAIYEKYSDLGFTIIGINQDSPRSVAKVKAYVSSHNLSFPIVTDASQEIFQQFNGQSIPLTILYNKKGEVIYKHVGYLPGDEIELEKEIKIALGIDN
jgi:cytochrome c biogenesis protein CcmG, thiol:disulfide interchange protein DsbE